MTIPSNLAAMQECLDPPDPMSISVELPEPQKPRRHIVARVLDRFYGFLLETNQKDRSSGRQLGALILLVSAVLGVPWACMNLAKGASKDLGAFILLFIPVWLLLLFVGAIGHGLRCPSCHKWWSRKTATYAETQAPVVTERDPSFEKPGTDNIVRTRSVSWSATYHCKRCGHGWSREASGERVSRTGWS